MALQRGTNHASEKLGDIGGVLRVTKRHHGFRSRAVPARGKILFEEHHTDFPVVSNIRGVHMVELQAIGFNVRRLSEGMNDFIFGKMGASSRLDAGETFTDFRGGRAVLFTVFHLDDQHRAYLLGVLRLAVIVPTFALVLPLVGCRL